MKRKPSKAITNRKPDKWAKAALKGCDWFVNSQIIQQRPNWDANHGRYQYNVHVPTSTRVMGIGWTQARAVMCLLSAYLRTGNEKYLASAELGVNYMKVLQNMDQRNALTYGVFHEETPHSRFAFPRDAIEVADALMQWHLVTGDPDALYRAELFFKWFRRNALTSFPNFGFWVKGDVQFDPVKKAQFKRPASCEMGCGTIYAHAFLLTRKPVYQTMALKIADATLANYVKESVAPMTEPPRDTHSHHTSREGHILNDDGGGVTLLNAYRLSGRKKYLDACVRIAEYFRLRKEPMKMFSAIGSAANFLLEVDRVTGRDTYRKTAERLAREMIKLQVKSGDRLVRGGFRGEDEGGKWYYKGSANDDFVTTRVTAYAVFTLFKLEGLIPVRGYSVTF